MLSKQQFVVKMNSNDCRQVVPVDQQPSQLLALRDCADTAVDIEDVQLQDGMRLAMVAGAEDGGNRIKHAVRGSLCTYTHSTGLFIYFVDVQHICALHSVYSTLCTPLSALHSLHSGSGLRLEHAEHA